MLLVGCASVISDKTAKTTETHYAQAEPITVAPVDEMTVTLEELGIYGEDDSKGDAYVAPTSVAPTAASVSKTAEVVINSDHPKSKARVTYSLSADPAAGTVTASIDSLTVEQEKEVVEEITTREVVKEPWYARFNKLVIILGIVVVLLLILAILFRRKL